MLIRRSSIDSDVISLLLTVPPYILGVITTFVKWVFSGHYLLLSKQCVN